MKKLLLSLVIVLSASTAQSQTKNWYLGVIASPNFYSMSASGAGVNRLITYQGNALGLEGGYCIKDDLNLGLGAQISTLSYEMDYNSFFMRDGDTLFLEHRYTRATYLDIPISLRYQVFSKPKLAAYTTATFGLHLMLSSSDELLFADNTTQETNWLNPLIISGQLGVGLAYKLTSQLRLKLEPRLRVYLQGFDIVMTKRPNLVQTVVGLEYLFGQKI